MMIGVALVLRLVVASWPVFHHSDELWQYLEPARHLTGHDWVATWEYRSGARSWLLPMLFAGPVALGDWIAPGTFLSVVLARLVCVAVSLGAIAGAAGLGFRVSRLHGLVAAFVACFWYELVYFAPRTLSEPIATALILLACWLLFASDRKRLVPGGLLLGVACMVRIQYAPAALVLAAWALRLDTRNWLRFAIGGTAALAISAVADLLAGAVPFGWIVQSVSANLIAGKAASFGVSPPYGYLTEIAGLWGWAAIPILALAVVGARRYPALFAAAAVNLAVHSAIGHKEYRFILLTTVLLVLLAAIGSVDVAGTWRKAPRAALVLGTAWLALSIGCGALGSSTRDWGQNGKLVRAWRMVRDARGLCAAAVYRMREQPIASYTLLGRDVPLYQFDDEHAASARTSRAFNLLLGPEATARDVLGFRLLGCGDSAHDYCVFQRPGGCSAGAADRAFRVDGALAQAKF